MLIPSGAAQAQLSNPLKFHPVRGRRDSDRQVGGLVKIGFTAGGAVD
jgi:hypothetical protein